MRATLNHLLTSVILVVLILATIVSCSADIVADSQLLKSYIKDREWDSALSQLKTLITTYPNEAASFIIGDETKDFWGLRLPDAIEALRQAADTSLKDDVGLKLRVALLDCYKDQAEWDKAFPLLDNLKVDYPDQQCAYHNLKSICYQRQEKYETALEEMRSAVSSYSGSQDEKTFLNQILDCYPSDKEKIMVRISYVFLRYGPSASTSKKAGFYRWAGLACIKANRPVESMAAYRKSLELCDLPEDEKTFISHLLDCYSLSTNKHEASIPGAVFTLLSDSPGSSDKKKAELYKHVGLVCLQQAHRPVEAATALKKAVQLNNAGGFGNGLNFIFSNTWIDGGKLLLDLAKMDCMDADSLNYCKAIAKYYQMYNYLDSNQYEKAIPVCKEIVSSNIDGGLALTALSVLTECLYPLGRVQEAYDFADEYYRAHPDRQMEADWVRIHSAYWAERDYTKTVSLCEEFAVEHPNSTMEVQAINIHLSSLECLGRPEAVEELKKSMNDASPESRTDLVRRIASVYFMMNDYTNASICYQEWFSTAYISSQDKPKALFRLGLCQWETGNIGSACNCMKRITKYYSGTEWAQKAQGLLHIWSAY